MEQEAGSEPEDGEIRDENENEMDKYPFPRSPSMERVHSHSGRKRSYHNENRNRKRLPHKRSHKHKSGGSRDSSSHQLPYHRPSTSANDYHRQSAAEEEEGVIDLGFQIHVSGKSRQVIRQVALSTNQRKVSKHTEMANENKNPKVNSRRSTGQGQDSRRSSYNSTCGNSWSKQKSHPTELESPSRKSQLLASKNTANKDLSDTKKFCGSSPSVVHPQHDGQAKSPEIITLDCTDTSDEEKSRKDLNSSQEDKSACTSSGELMAGTNELTHEIDFPPSTLYVNTDESFSENLNGFCDTNEDNEGNVCVDSDEMEELQLRTMLLTGLVKRIDAGEDSSIESIPATSLITQSRTEDTKEEEEALREVLLSQMHIVARKREIALQKTESEEANVLSTQSSDTSVPSTYPQTTVSSPSTTSITLDSWDSPRTERTVVFNDDDPPNFKRRNGNRGRRNRSMDFNRQQHEERRKEMLQENVPGLLAPVVKATPILAENDLRVKLLRNRILNPQPQPPIQTPSSNFEFPEFGVRDTDLRFDFRLPDGQSNVIQRTVNFAESRTPNATISSESIMNPIRIQIPPNEAVPFIQSDGYRSNFTVSPCMQQHQLSLFSPTNLASSAGPMPTNMFQKPVGYRQVSPGQKFDYLPSATASQYVPVTFTNLANPATTFQNQMPVDTPTTRYQQLLGQPLISTVLRYQQNNNAVPIHNKDAPGLHNQYYYQPTSTGGSASYPNVSMPSPSGYDWNPPFTKISPNSSLSASRINTPHGTIENYSPPNFLMQVTTSHETSNSTTYNQSSNNAVYATQSASHFNRQQEYIGYERSRTLTDDFTSQYGQSGVSVSASGRTFPIVSAMEQSSNNYRIQSTRRNHSLSVRPALSTLRDKTSPRKRLRKTIRPRDTPNVLNLTGKTSTNKLTSSNQSESNSKIFSTVVQSSTCDLPKNNPSANVKNSSEDVPNLPNTPGIKGLSTSKDAGNLVITTKALSISTPAATTTANVTTMRKNESGKDKQILQPSTQQNMTTLKTLSATDGLKTCGSLLLTTVPVELPVSVAVKTTSPSPENVEGPLSSPGTINAPLSSPGVAKASLFSGSNISALLSHKNIKAPLSSPETVKTPISFPRADKVPLSSPGTVKTSLSSPRTVKTPISFPESVNVQAQSSTAPPTNLVSMHPTASIPLSSTGATVKTPLSTPGTVRASLPSPGTVKTTVFSSGIVETLVLSPGIVKTPVFSSGIVETLVLSPGIVKTPVLSHGTVKTSISSPGTIKPLVPSPGNVKTLISSPGTVKTLISSPGTIKTLISSPGTVKTLISSPGTVKPLISSPGTVKTPISSPGTVKTPISSPGTGKTPISSPGTVKTPISSPGTVKTPITSSGTVKTPISSPGTVKTPISSPGTVKTPTSSPGTIKTPTSSLGATVKASLSSHGTGKTPISFPGSVNVEAQSSTAFPTNLVSMDLIKAKMATLQQSSNKTVQPKLPPFQRVNQKLLTNPSSLVNVRPGTNGEPANQMKRKLENTSVNWCPPIKKMIVKPLVIPIRDDDSSTSTSSDEDLQHDPDSGLDPEFQAKLNDFLKTARNSTSTKSTDDSIRIHAISTLDNKPDSTKPGDIENEICVATSTTQPNLKVQSLSKEKLPEQPSKTALKIVDDVSKSKDSIQQSSSKTSSEPLCQIPHASQPQVLQGVLKKKNEEGATIQGASDIALNDKSTAGPAHDITKTVTQEIQLNQESFANTSTKTGTTKKMPVAGPSEKNSSATTGTGDKNKQTGKTTKLINDMASSKVLINRLMDQVTRSHEIVKLSTAEKNLINVRQRCLARIRSIKDTLKQSVTMGTLESRMQIDINMVELKLAALKSRQALMRERSKVLNDQVVAKTRKLLPDRAECLKLYKESRIRGRKIYDDYTPPSIFSNEISLSLQELDAINSKRPLQYQISNEDFLQLTRMQRKQPSASASADPANTTLSPQSDINELQLGTSKVISSNQEKRSKPNSAIHEEKSKINNKKLEDKSKGNSRKLQEKSKSRSEQRGKISKDFSGNSEEKSKGNNGNSKHVSQNDSEKSEEMSKGKSGKSENIENLEELKTDDGKDKNSETETGKQHGKMEAAASNQAVGQNTVSVDEEQIFITRHGTMEDGQEYIIRQRVLTNEGIRQNRINHYETIRDYFADLDSGEEVMRFDPNVELCSKWLSEGICNDPNCNCNHP